MMVPHEKDHDMQLDAHKSAVAKAYGLASAGYNKPALKFFSQGAEALVDFAGLSRGQRILDVATGTGHAALYAGLKVGAEHGSVVGIDIAKEMVHLANDYAKTLSRGNVRFELMDGEHTTFADDEFDAVLCSYGIFFLPDMANGITEWKRVTRPGGWVCFSAFGDTAFQPQSDLFEQRIRQFGPLIPDKKRPFGWQRLVDPQALVALLDQAGMTNVEVREVTIGYLLRDAERWWDICWNSGFRGPLAQLKPADLQQFKEEHLREVEALRGRDGIFFDGTTFVAKGQVNT
jgi:ubiquinone/menaquinone biosynthesis C-methylase UbiE